MRQRTGRTDDVVQHVVRVRFAKILGQLALDVIGVLMEMVKNRAVENEGFQSAGPLPEHLEKRLPKIKSKRLRA